MIKGSHITELLKDNSFSFSKEEIEKIMETELAKAEEDMDTELIELCLDLLNKKARENSVNPKKRSFSSVALLVATAAVLVFAMTSVFPALSNSKPELKPTDNVTVHTTPVNETTVSPTTGKPDDADNLPTEAKPVPSTKGEETTKTPDTVKGEHTLASKENIESTVRKLFSANGFDNLLLPAIIFENGKILNKSFSKNNAEIEISSKEKKYNIIIEKSSEAIEEKNSIDVNGLSVSVESENNSSEITYRKNNFNYRIVFHSDYEEAVRIAKTIC